jgi:hypothetical protein
MKWRNLGSKDSLSSVRKMRKREQRRRIKNYRKS